jgi:hypothetical protein
MFFPRAIAWFEKCSPPSHGGLHCDRVMSG